MAEREPGELLEAVVAINRIAPLATAKEVHERLVQKERFADVSVASVKRACQKAAKQGLIKRADAPPQPSSSGGGGAGSASSRGGAAGSEPPKAVKRAGSRKATSRAPFSNSRLDQDLDALQNKIERKLRVAPPPPSSRGGLTAGGVPKSLLDMFGFTEAEIKAAMPSQQDRSFGFRDYEIEELRCQGIKPWDPEARAAVEMLFPGRRPYDPKKPDPIDDSDDDYDDDYEPGLFDKLVSSHPDRRCRALLASVAHDSQVDDLNREVLANMSKMNDPALLAHMIQTFKQGLPD